MALKDNLSRIRQAAGLSQTALAKLAGVSQQMVSRVESGADLTTKKLPEIARALNVSVAELDESYSVDGEDDLVQLLRRADPAVKAAVALILRNSAPPSKPSVRESGSPASPRAKRK